MNQHERDLADLLRRQAEATTLTAPPLDAIMAEGKAAARRRNRDIGVVAMGAAAAVVAVIAIPLGVLHATGSAPAPVGPVGPSAPPGSTTPNATQGATQDTTQNTAASRIIAAARVPYATAVTSTGEVASLWVGCQKTTSCGTAWMLTSGARTVTGIVPTNRHDNAEDEQLVDGGDGFLVVSDDSTAPSSNFVLDYGGSTTPLRRDDTLTTDPADPMYDGTAVYRDNGQSVWVASAKLDTWAPLVAGGSKGSSIGPGLIEGETAWVGQVVDGKPVLQWLPMDGSWHSHPLLSTSPYISPGFHDLYVGQVAVARGGMVAATSVLAGDDRDLLVGLCVSHDGGATWTDIPGTSLPFVDDGVAAGATPPPHAGSAVDVFDMAATMDGTLFVDAWNGRLYRSTDRTWTHFAPVAGMTDAEHLQSLGDDAVAVTEPAKGSVGIARVSSNGSARTIVELGAKTR